MNKKIIENFEKIRDVEVENFNKVGCSHFNIFILDGKPDGKITAGIVMTPGGNDDFLKNRFDYLYKIGKIMKNQEQVNAIAVISISEAWVSKVHKDDADSYKKNIGMPSKDPKKKEVLLFAVMDNNDETVMYMHEIKDEKGKRLVNPKPMSKKHTSVENELLGSFWKGHKGFVKV